MVKRVCTDYSGRVKIGVSGMKYFNIDKAIQRYNNIMMAVCYEHSTIGTDFSENTENWNIRDMVSECAYVLSTYYEEGHANEELRHTEDRKIWLSETGKLKRFIEAYKPFIGGVICTQGHCSEYDNYNADFRKVGL